MASSKNIVVGAIDFGTTYSGWAFSLLTEYKSQPTKVNTGHWQSGGTLITEKAPTCVLIKPDGKTLEAFGYDAENEYKNLVDRKEDKGYYYFKHFKMALNKQLNENVRRDFTIENDVGQSLPALTVFSQIIKFLTENMLESVNNGMADALTMDDVSWVLTVPAIWTDSAKNFMREAAKRAGIDGDRLLLCLEPEAASIFCRHLPMVKKEDVSIASLPPGESYMILDCGGGTIDITVHQIQATGDLKEVRAASGGGWGGILVDEAFKNLLIELITKQVYDKFASTEKEDWLDLWRDFEVKKKQISPRDNARFVMKVPASLASIYQETKHMPLHDAIESSRHSSDLELDRDKLKIGSSVARSLFDNSINKTVSHVKTLLTHPKVSGIKTILMVGGFSDSSMLQSAIKSALPGMSVRHPNEAVTVILKGAVIFGHNPKSVTERVLKYTYGVDNEVPFKEGTHPPYKRVVRDCGERCTDVFSKHVEVDQTVSVGQSCAEQLYTPLNISQTTLAWDIYASTLKHPQFVDEGCTKIGRLSMANPRPGQLDVGAYVSFKFGGTEIEVTGRDSVTGEKTTINVDFLG